MAPDHLMDIVFPSRDQSLARVISDLSEPESGKTADNLITNEDSFARVAPELARLAPRGGVYLGVGPDQNFTYMAHARPSLAFILDFRRRNSLLHLAHKALFALSHDRASYLARLMARQPLPFRDKPSAGELVNAFLGPPMDRGRLDSAIADVAGYLVPPKLVADGEWSEIATIQAKLAGPGLNARFLALPMYPSFGALIKARDRQDHPAHFLAREEWYQAVRNMQMGDRVIPLVADFAGSHSMSSLGAWLHRRGLAISVFYASDVEFFLLRSGRFATYAANLAKLPWQVGALIVRTSTREIAHPERIRGDSSTTIIRPVAPFLEAAREGRIRTVEDLFSEEI